MRIARCKSLLTGLMALAVMSGDVFTAGAAAAQATPARGSIVRLLREGRPVLGIFSGDHTAAQGAVMVKNRETDFVFYSLESGPFELPTMQAYMKGMADAAGSDTPHPLALRIPAIRTDRQIVAERVRQALAAGVEAIVFPHVESADDAIVAVRSMGTDAWPQNPTGTRVNMLIIEDRVGVENARAITRTAGVGVVFAGPGDLRRAYNADMAAVENAIQTVLAACKEANVPCGITAGPSDITERLDQGFRVIIVTQPEALTVARTRR